ncbi:MAG: PAS domain-containing sensor histidine kinase [Alphaproteobacteria bacterium]|nr:PAS domain-containing sensor histidine kinase [Alphaproteobacteria bacterium]
MTTNWEFFYAHPVALLKEWSKRYNVGRKLLILLVAGSILSVIATYVTLTKAPPFLKSQRILIFLLSIDFAFLLTLAAVVAKYIAALGAERKSDQAGSKLQGRIVAIFSLLAVAPTILIAIFSAIFFNIVIQSWFNQRVETAIGESIAIAGAYLGEHQKVISANAQAMAAELTPIVDYLFSDSEILDHKLTDEVQHRALDEAIVFNGNMQVLGRSRFSFSLDFESIPRSDLENAKTAPVIYTNQENDRVRALVAVNTLTNTYLLVGRGVSPTVLRRIENASNAAQEYARLEAQGSNLALKFAGIFVGIAVLLLLSAVLAGLLFANKLARPIRRLIEASDEVCKGNLSVRIAAEDETEELSSLTSAFNRMTAQLESQRDELMIANEQLDGRRQFTEAVLAGVSAGVIGLDAKGNINLPNQSASKLLKTDLAGKIGKKLVKVIPEMTPLFKEMKEIGTDFIEAQITLNRNGHGHTLLVRISIEHAKNKLTGYVVTFDDITQLQAAQRKAAWADMARRIAHEIKNPLTPIQLSAERLKRRYTQQIVQDPESFHKCVDTIIRQVDHIGKLVGEFSSFARMPTPNIKPEDFVKTCKEEIFLQKQAHPHIQFEFIASSPAISFSYDRAQIGQVLTNLIKNAVEAIEVKKPLEGQIQIFLNEEDHNIILKISDNGSGLPSEGRERLTEPYVTFRDKGTGLGLAIVKKIVEDHGGTLSFHDGPLGGAEIQLSFARSYVAQHIVN